MALTICSAVSAAPPVDPDNVYVSPTGDDVNGDGSSTYPYQTIQQGFTTVNDVTGTVNLLPGTYGASGDYGLTITKSITIAGSGHQNTIIDPKSTDPNVNSQVFTVNSGLTVLIKDLTIQNGNSGSWQDGGAIQNLGILTVENCYFAENTGRNGGAISNIGTLTVEDSSFSTNSAEAYGGAIGSIGTGTFNSCIFTTNTADSGGGAIAIGTGGMGITVNGCTFISNTATGTGGVGGGAIYVFVQSLTANYNRFYNNIANPGSAIFINQASTPPNLENNWWGLNNPITSFPGLIANAAAPTQWLFMTVSADPTTVNNGENSQITVSFNNYSQDGTTSTEFTPVGSNHIPDGTPVTFATTLGSIPGTVFNTVGGTVTTTFTASQTAGTAYISGLIDNYQTPYDPNNPNTTPYTTVTINPVVDPVITKTINNPKAKYNVGDVVTYTIKVTNNGPDTAQGSTITDDVSGIGNNMVDYFQFVSATGPYTFDDVTKTVTWTLPDLAVGDSVTYTLKVKILKTAAGQSIRNKADLWLNEYPGHVYDVIELYVAKANLYIHITSDKKNPNVGEPFTLTYKLGNKGPDTAQNVKTTIKLPAGFHVTKISGDGTWKYDEATNTIIWTMANVPVGDPYLHITGWLTKAGSYVFTASINSNTYNINTNGITPLTINAQNVVSAKTIGMQKTGTPIIPAVLAFLLIVSGMLYTKKQE